MSGRALEINGRKVWILETGTGAPLLYLHGFADVHSVKESWMPFHEKLAQHASVIAPAHPGCAQTDENKDIDIIFTVVTRLEISKLTNEIDQIDPTAFVVMHSINETKGGIIKRRPLH